MDQNISFKNVRFVQLITLKIYIYTLSHAPIENASSGFLGIAPAATAA
jgi:hypothetical protein